MAPIGPHAFAEFEKELHERMMEAERDIVASEMARVDIDADAVVNDGKVRQPNGADGRRHGARIARF